MQENKFNTAKIMRLFLLFACLENGDQWHPLVEAAIQQVERECRADADRSDERLSFYCAAIANLHYRQTIAAQGAVSPTYAGAVTVRRDDTQPCSLAERLVSAYRTAAADLLTDDAFVFCNIH